MVDWEGIERSEEFRELVKKRRSFVVPATIFFLAYYMAFIIVAGYAPDFMAESVYQGLTVGYCYALTQFLMVFVLGHLVPAQGREGVRPAGRRGRRCRGGLRRGGRASSGRPTPAEVAR